MPGIFDILQPQIEQGLLQQLLLSQQPVNKWQMIGDALTAASAGMLKAPPGQGIGYGAIAATQALSPYAAKMRGQGQTLEELKTMADVAKVFKPGKASMTELQKLQTYLASLPPDSKEAQQVQAAIDNLTISDAPETWQAIAPSELPLGARSGQRSSRGKMDFEWAPQAPQAPETWSDIPKDQLPEGVLSGQRSSRGEVDYVMKPGAATPPTTWKPIPKEELPPGARAGQISSSGKIEYEWMPASGIHDEEGGIPGKTQESLWLNSLSEMSQRGWDNLSGKEKYSYNVMYGRLMSPKVTINADGQQITTVPQLVPGINPPPGSIWEERAKAQGAAAAPADPNATPALAGPAAEGNAAAVAGVPPTPTTETTLPTPGQYMPPVAPESGIERVELSRDQKKNLRTFEDTNDALTGLAALVKSTPWTEKVNPFSTGGGPLNAAYIDAVNGLRVLAATGVLNMGELPFLRKMLEDPTGFVAASNPARVLGQIDQLQKILRTKQENMLIDWDKRAKEAARGGPAAPTPTAPVTQAPNYEAMSLEEYLRGAR